MTPHFSLDRVDALRAGEQASLGIQVFRVLVSPRVSRVLVSPTFTVYRLNISIPLNVLVVQVRSRLVRESYGKDVVRKCQPKGYIEYATKRKE